MPAAAPNLIKTGSTIFMQAAARMMHAAWILRQIEETSTAPGLSISGVAYSMRLTVAAEISMAFELALKSVAQGLSPHPDGQPQVPSSHDLSKDLWTFLAADVRREIDAAAEAAIRNRYDYADAHVAVLPFADYLAKHHDFLDRTVLNRYALHGTTQWKSDHRFIDDDFTGPVYPDTYDGNACLDLDGMGVLLAYWWAIMRKACGLRWEDHRCDADERLAADRDEAWELVERAIRQMLGDIRVMTPEELQQRRRENRKASANATPARFPTSGLAR